MSMDNKQAQSVAGKVQVGDHVPNFTLPSQSGAMINLKDYIGKSAIVLYFYPADNTSGCTAEACAFRDNYEIFKDAGAEVIGVSSDATETHQKFTTRHSLPFILLSDKKGTVRKLFGAKFALFPGRVTYIIDKEGIVRHIFSSFRNIEKHISEALKTIQSFDQAHV